MAIKLHYWIVDYSDETPAKPYRARFSFDHDRKKVEETIGPREVLLNDSALLPTPEMHKLAKKVLDAADEANRAGTFDEGTLKEKLNE
tara:strand:- start:2975 stop:3238 length:264 start_codon:yes stop_codon:yes gene_type:complete